MAARAHAVHDYSFAGASERPRRQVWVPDDYDEVVLPRRHSSFSGVLVLSAVLASALIGGAAYTVYWWAAPTLSETPTAPLSRTWEPDATFMELNVVKALQSPAIAPPKAAVQPAQAIVDVNDLPQTPAPARATQQEPREHEVILHDSAPGFQDSLPQPAGQAAPALTEPVLPDPILPKKEAPTTPEVPYPNPTTTPPEMTEPPVYDDGLEPPKVDLDNPY